MGGDTHWPAAARLKAWRSEGFSPEAAIFGDIEGRNNFLSLVYLGNQRN